MSNKHTPGPWRAMKDADGWSIISKEVPLLRVAKVPFDAGEEGEFGPQAAFHDARLMAAAPDLLEVCQKVSEQGCFCEHPGDTRPICTPCLARKAIAEAKGKTMAKTDKVELSPKDLVSAVANRLGCKVSEMRCEDLHGPCDVCGGGHPVCKLCGGRVECGGVYTACVVCGSVQMSSV